MEKQNKLDIDITADVAEGTYSNLAIVSHSPTEFTIDFAQMLPALPKGVVRERIIMAPVHFKRLCQAIEDNLARYESRFGEITEPDLSGEQGDTLTYPIQPMGNA
ncbi:MAG: DUF3467 domain-containing protein [Bacteroidales bacterium]|nr:DUF3467 domain-containing protein [Bacteroidales bacterium]